MKSNISILLATYNGHLYLWEQLESIIGQSYTDFELLIQDDGSTDGTWEVLEEYAARDKRIQLFRNAENLGIARNFLSLIEKAEGEYIAISDQDDVWQREKLETLVSHIGDASLIYSDSVLIDKDGAEMGMTLLERLNKPTGKEGKYLLDLFTHNTISGHACLFSHELKPVLLRYQQFWCAETVVYDMVLGTLASLQDGVAYYPTPLSRHRIHSANNQNKSLHEIGKKRNRAGFVTRRRQRIATKVAQHLHLLSLLEDCTSAIANNKVSSIFARRPSDQFHLHFFNFPLYYSLLKTDLPAKTARDLACGKWYYYLLKWF